MLQEDAADRAAAVENAAIVPRTGPQLVTFFGVIDQRAEKRSLQGFSILPTTTAPSPPALSTIWRAGAWIAYAAGLKQYHHERRFRALPGLFPAEVQSDLESSAWMAPMPCSKSLARPSFGISRYSKMAYRQRRKSLGFGIISRCGK
jgi:hypothetical protein